MKTYHLGNDQVRGYVVDFLRRLAGLERVPTIWCAITESGKTVLEFMAACAKDEAPNLLEQVRLLRVDVDSESEQAIFSEDPTSLVRGQSVLLLDGAVHSGRTMSLCVDEILKYEPLDLHSYSLVLKRASTFIPTHWGLMTDDTDRAFFLLPQLPNNRLNAGKRPPAPVHLRLLGPNHVALPPLRCGVDSMDRMTWGDRFFQMKAGSDLFTYVLERSREILGYLTVRFSDDRLAIDEVAVDSAHQGNGYAGILLRFADTLARQSNCASVELNAIRERVELYKSFGYRETGRPALPLGPEEYVPMARQVLYHTPTGTYAT